MPGETRGARSARADARLCTSSGINLIVPLSFHLVRWVIVQAMARRSPGDKEPGKRRPATRVRARTDPLKCALPSEQCVCNHHHEPSSLANHPCPPCHHPS